MGSASRLPRANGFLAVPDNYIRIGVIAGGHGLRGALRLRPDNPASDALKPGTRVVIARPDRQTEHEIKTVAPLGHGLLRITVAEVTNIDEAAALKGSLLMIARRDLPAAGPGEFYYFQALGCEVLTADGRRLGRIEELFSNGAHDIIVVRDGAVEYLIPVIVEVVRTMDFAARRVTIEPLPGLLD